MSDTIREQLHKQIDSLPQELVEQIADFTLFVMARKKLSPGYAEWEHSQWQSFALEQLFDEDEEDEVTYSLEDAEEVFRR
jgi:hypothetical protein